ncbi:MAG: dihydropyrimidinase [Paracoccaceae bacterium]|nr:dihydropyrimidinase [Paracoccaceae bacterium]
MDEENDLVIRGGKIVTPSGIIQSDMAIKNTIISATGHNLGDAKVDVSAHGKFIMPGGVDSHAHIEQMSGMGQMNADTFETATRSAAMGGTTSIISFAAQTAGQTLSDTVANYAARARRGAMIDFAFHLTITDMTVLNFEDDLAALIATGHRSLKFFTTYNIQLSDQKILKVLTLARKYGALVGVHAENDAIISNAKEQLLSAGHKAPRYHAQSRPRVAAIEAVERICRFAQYLDQPVMLFHLSTSEGASAVKAAQARGAPVLAETCPHYLFMTEEVLDQPGLEGAKFMCSPPQRTTTDQNALWQALKEGTLALVSSVHAPYRYDETGKLSAGPDAVFNEIANGLPGLETRLPLMFDAMVSRCEQGAQAFAQITATAPAKLYGLQKKGALVAGMDADIVIWDPDRKVTYGANDLSDNVGYNPWEGRTVKGWPENVVLRGKFLVKDGQFLGSVGAGNWIDRPELATKPSGGSRQEFRT